MIVKPQIFIDDRETMQIVQELLSRRWGYVPEWRPGENGADAALAWIFAHYLQTILHRLNQAPEKNKLAFLDLLGLELVPAQAARARIVFAPSRQNEDLVQEALKNLKAHISVPVELPEPVSDSRAPAGTQAAAPPPPGKTDQIVFETESAIGITTARLQEVVSLLPGQDQYVDHSVVLQANEPIQLFSASPSQKLQNTPHEIYLAHDTWLALAGQVTLGVDFILTATTNIPLIINWEYWDGQKWHELKVKEDRTNKLTQTGLITLIEDNAKTAKTVVNSIEAFWIRGRLAEPLLPVTVGSLPTVENLKLKSTLTRKFEASQVGEPQFKLFGGLPPIPVLIVIVKSEAGLPLNGISVYLTSIDDSILPSHGLEGKTDKNGVYKFPSSFLILGKTYNVYPFDLKLSFTYKHKTFTAIPSITFVLSLSGMPFDKAFADATALEVSKSFYPFGQQPQPGSTFYFSQEEVFSKPGAQVQIYVARTSSPQDQVTPQSPDTIPHTVSWEYWNGQQWKVFDKLSNITSPPADLNASGIVELTVPTDMTKTKVNGEDGLWMRVRLVSGGYGFKQVVNFNQNTFTHIIHQPPVLTDFSIGYTWSSDTLPPERVVTYNDFQYEDHSQDVAASESSFLPFKPVSDKTPALYLGFDKKLPSDRVGLFFDIEEKHGETQRPAMVWEYWNGVWQELVVEDETRNLRVPGILSFIAAADSKSLARFGKEELHWIRGRLRDGDSPGAPTINAIFLNAVWASQQRTLNDTPLGSSSGVVNQVFRFTQTPVLAGERIEVRELAGARANVEWRILARAFSTSDPNLTRDLEEMLSRENLQTDLMKGDLRLRLDRNKRVAEVWVRWQEKRHLLFSGPEDRHYVINRTAGLLVFGDGIHGKIPPAGAAIMAKQFRTGGGLAGNVAAEGIKQLLSGVPGIERVFNPRPAEGGANSETLEAFSRRGPQTVRHRGRAITSSDYETMAYEASPAVAVARVMSNRKPNGKFAPGWVTVLIIPQSQDPRPWPSFGLREQVRKFIASRAPVELFQANQIDVIGPNYLPIDMDATIAIIDPAEAGDVERRSREALAEFFHPLRGGPERRGWELGRDVFLSDVAAVLERVAGVDYVETLAFSLLVTPKPKIISIFGSSIKLPLPGFAVPGERIEVPDDRIVVAGNIRLTMKAAER